MNDVIDALKPAFPPEPPDPGSFDHKGIHEDARVHPDATIEDRVSIGAFSNVGPRVTIREGSHIQNNVNIKGNTVIGKNNVIFPFSSIGTVPQDLSYEGSDCRLIIGDRNVIRESVTINVGTEKDRALTRIGSENYLMAYCHVAHDCELEDDIQIANGVQLGGHVTVRSRAAFGGLAAVHHFVTIGTCAFVGGMSRITRDVPPYMTSAGYRGRVRSVNTEGLKRNGFSEQTINSLKKVHKKIFRSDGSRKEELEELREHGCDSEEIRKLVAFLENSRESPQGRAREADRDF